MYIWDRPHCCYTATAWVTRENHSFVHSFTSSHWGTGLISNAACSSIVALETREFWDNIDKSLHSYHCYSLHSTSGPACCEFTTHWWLTTLSYIVSLDFNPKTSCFTSCPGPFQIPYSLSMFLVHACRILCPRTVPLLKNTSALALKPFLLWQYGLTD